MLWSPLQGDERESPSRLETHGLWQCPVPPGGMQNTEKTDEVSMAKAEEEFIKAQIVSKELNRELLKELPIPYNSLSGCYMTIFQNISKLRHVFHREMSKLNHNSMR